MRLKAGAGGNGCVDALCGCRGGSRTALTSRHPQHIPKPNDNCPLRHRRASLYIDHMRHSHAERPSFPRRREPRIPAALVWMSGPLALWERVRVPPTSRHPKRIPKPNDNCPLRRRRASPYIDHMRHSHAESSSFPRRREPRIPAALVWMSGSLALWERVRVRVPPAWTPPPTSPNPTTTAHCAAAAPAPTLITCVIHTPSPRRSREGGNLASLPSVPSFQRRLESRRMRVRTIGNGTKWNKTEQN